MTIEKKTELFPCYQCDGKGKINKKKCPLCKGSGKWKETTYYFIDEKTKQGFSGDTLK